MSKPAPLVSRGDVEVEDVRAVWEGRFTLQLVRFGNTRFDGTRQATREWELWRRGRAAAVLPYDPVRDVVVLIEQFRVSAFAAGLDPVMVEIPAGMCDGDETPEATILRESQEEMHLAVSDLQPVGDFLLSPGGCDERCAIFAGRVSAPQAGPDGVVGGGGLASEQEDLRVRLCSAEVAIARALAGEYPNSVTTIALLWLAANRDRLRREWGSGT